MFNEIADDYALKRNKPWKALITFMNNVKDKRHQFKGICLDMGCANGRNFELFSKEDSHVVGLDNSWKFMKIAQKRIKDNPNINLRNKYHIHLLQADMKGLPIRKESIQNIFCIASFHHVESEPLRLSVMTQIFEVLQVNGHCLMTVWRRWQKKYKKYFFYEIIKRILVPGYSRKQKKRGLPDFGDQKIPWVVNKEKITIYRFYHFFSKKEIKRYFICFKIEEFRTMGGPTSKDNFFLLARKEERKCNSASS